MSRTDNSKKRILFLIVTLSVLGLMAAIICFYLKGNPAPPPEHPVTVARVIASGSDGWLLPNKVLTGKISDSKQFLNQVINLRARKVPVDLLGYSETTIQIKKEALPCGALIIVDPQGLKDNEPVYPVAGIEDTQLIQLVLEAGVAAFERKDVRECLRFLSYRYQDPWGYNSKLIETFLKRAFKEFSQFRVEVLKAPNIGVAGDRALVQMAVRLRAMYRSRSSYLLGDSKGFNQVVISLKKETSGWKLVQVRGLKPLGFDERFLKVIGFEIGLPLNEAEQQERQTACMPCRERMVERFGKVTSK